MAANFKNYIIRGTEMFIYLFIIDFIIEMFLIKGNAKLTTVLGLHVESFITPDEQEVTLYPLSTFLIFLDKIFQMETTTSYSSFA